MALFDRHNKIVAVYALVKDPDRENFLTITPTINDCLEYAEAILKMQHIDHYTSWCKLRKLSPDAEQVWNQYYSDVIPADEKTQYVVLKVRYTMQNLTALLRLLLKCIPLGCSFNDEREYMYLLEKTAEQIPKSDSKENVEKIDKLQKDIDSLKKILWFDLEEDDWSGK